MKPVHHQNQDTNDRLLANIQRNGKSLKPTRGKRKLIRAAGSRYFLCHPENSRRRSMTSLDRLEYILTVSL
jgi:hypothetical protein